MSKYFPNDPDKPIIDIGEKNVKKIEKGFDIIMIGIPIVGLILYTIDSLCGWCLS